MISSSHRSIDASASGRPFQKKILIVSLDYDGCLSEESFTAELNKLNGDVKSPAYAEQYQQILSQTRKDFIDDINDKAQGYDEVVVMIGSNRQTLAIDKSNNRRYKNGSCIVTLNHFAMALAAALRKPVQVDLRMYEDALSEKEPGYFANQLQLAVANNDDLKAVNENIDLSHIGDHKYCMIYLQILQLCLTQPDCEFGFVFYDDKKSIIDEAIQVFSAAKKIEKIMPANLGKMELVHYRTSILSFLQEKMMDLARMKNSSQVIDPVTIEFLLTITRITLQLVDKLEQLLQPVNERDRTAEMKQEMAARKEKKDKLTLAIQKRRKALYAEMANDPNMKDILQKMLACIKHQVKPAFPKHENHPYVIKLIDAVENEKFEELVELLVDGNIGIYIATLPNLFNEMRVNQLLPLANNAVKDCEEIKALQLQVNEIPDDSAIASLFNLKEAMLKQEYINQAKDFIAYVKSNRGQFTSQSLQKYLDGIIKLAELCRIENYPQAFEPGHAYNKVAEEKGFGEYIAAVRGVVIDTGLELSRRHQADHFCSMLQLTTQEKTCASTVKITTASQGAIVRACLDKSLWPDHSRPTIERLYRAYISAVELENNPDLCLMPEDVGDEELIHGYKAGAYELLETLNSEYQKLTSSMFSKFKATAIAINTYERRKLLKLCDASTLQEIINIAVKYERKLEEKIQMGAKLNPNSETANFMRYIARENDMTVRLVNKV